MGSILLLKCTVLTLVLWYEVFPVHCSIFVNMKKSPGQFASRLCGYVNIHSTVNLTCPKNTWFHVINKIMAEGSISDCSAESSYPTTNRVISSSVSPPPLAPVCRGENRTTTDPQVCHESIQVHEDLNRSNISFIEVNYECIDRNVIYNICERLFVTVTSGDLFLASPALFPPPADDASLEHSTCQCNLTSALGDFRVYPLYLSQFKGWNMTCESGECLWVRELVSFPVVNEGLFGAARQNESHIFHVEFLPFLQNSTTPNELWLRIRGGHPMTLWCNSAVQPSDFTSTTFTSSTTSASTEATYPGVCPSDHLADGADGLPDGVLVFLGFLGGAACVLLLGAAVYGMRRYLQKRTRLRKSGDELDIVTNPAPRMLTGVTNPNVGDDTTADDWNIYCDLQPEAQTDRGYTNAYTHLNYHQGDEVAQHRSDVNLAKSRNREAEERPPNARRDLSVAEHQYTDTGSSSRGQQMASNNGEVNHYLEILDDVNVNRVGDDGYLVPSSDGAHRTGM